MPFCKNKMVFSAKHLHKCLLISRLLLEHKLEKGTKSRRKQSENVFLEILRNQFRSSRPVVFCKKKMFLGILQNSQKDTCARLFSNFPEPLFFIKKQALTQLFSCDFCKIFKNTFFRRTTLVAASAS